MLFNFKIKLPKILAIMGIVFLILAPMNRLEASSSFLGDALSNDLYKHKKNLFNSRKSSSFFCLSDNLSNEPSKPEQNLFRSNNTSYRSFSRNNISYKSPIRKYKENNTVSNNTKIVKPLKNKNNSKKPPFIVNGWIRVGKKEFAHQWYSYNIFANKLKYDNVPILRELHFHNVTEKADHLYYTADFKNNKDAQIQIPDEKIMLDGSLIEVRDKDVAPLKSVAFMNKHAKATLTKDLSIDNIRIYNRTQTLTINRNVNFQGSITGKGVVKIIGKNIVPSLGTKTKGLTKILVKNKGNVKNAAIFKDLNASLLYVDGMAIIDSDYISSDILLARSATIKFNKALTTNPRIDGQDIGGQKAYGIGHVEFSGGGMVGHIGTNQPVASVKFDGGRYEIAGSIKANGDIIFNEKGQYIPSLTEAEIEGNFNLIPNLWVEVADNKLITLQKKKRLDIVASWNSDYGTEDDSMINQTDGSKEPKKNLAKKSKNTQQSKEKYQKLSDISSGFQLVQDRDKVNSKSKEAEKIAKATVKELIEKAMNEAILKTKKDDNVVIEADNPKQKESNYNKEAYILDDQSDKLPSGSIEHNKNLDNEQESIAIEVKKLLKQIDDAKKEIAAIEEIKKDLKAACKKL
ncbi:MAG: hypothetical protein HRU35_02675 [Rickettsiaceae bacterium]|nr:hypothetical protein [Rickettsiaceae bacterium]